MKREDLMKRAMPEIQLASSAGSIQVPTSAPTTFSSGAQGQATARFSIEGNAVLTGGLGDLALAGAKALLEHGARGIALIDVNANAAATGVVKLRKAFPSAQITVHGADVTDADALSAAVDNAAETLGSIDMLLCYAGVVDSQFSLDLSADSWRRVLDINTTGVFLAAQAAAKHMIKQETGGSIVVIASIAGHRVLFPQPQISYNVSKASLLQLTKNLAVEWARYGIRVNSISPGYMDTILNEGPGLERVRGMWTERCPMRRLGSIDELSGPLILLSSRSAGSFITGTDIIVDGGTTLI